MKYVDRGQSVGNAQWGFMFVRFVDKWPLDFALLTLIASGIIFCLHSSNSLDPDQDRQNVNSDLNLNRFDTMIVLLNYFF